MENEETGGIEHGGGESLGRCRPEFAGDPAVARDAVSVGEAVKSVLERIEAHLGGASDEQVRLPLRVVDALAGDVEILGFALDPDEIAAHLNGCYAGCAATHERVEDGLVVARFDGAKWQPDWETSGMIGVRSRSDAPHITDHRRAFTGQVPVRLCVEQYPLAHGSECAVHCVEAARTVPDNDLPQRKISEKGKAQIALHDAGLVVVENGSRADPPQFVQSLPLPFAIFGIRQVVGVFAVSVTKLPVAPFTASVANAKPALIFHAFAKIIGRRRETQVGSIIGQRRQHIPAITEIQRGASDGFDAAHSPASSAEQTRKPFSSCIPNGAVYMDQISHAVDAPIRAPMMIAVISMVPSRQAACTQDDAGMTPSVARSILNAISSVGLILPFSSFAMLLGSYSQRRANSAALTPVCLSHASRR